MNSPAIAEIMDYASLGEYHISTLTLGTVALGMAYGISNAGRSPDKREGQLVMNAAFQAGITALDTARSYGDAERLIGRVLAGCPPPLPVVVTKFKIDASALNNPDAARAKAMQDVRESLRQLGIGRVPVCLFHMERTMSAAAWQPVLHQVFTDLKREGLIDVAGVSVDHPQALGVLAEDPLLEAFQVPLNIMDLRLLQEGTLDRLHANGTFIFARSVYLQGLFFMEPAKLTGKLAPAREYLEQLRQLAAAEGLTVQELAFSFVHGLQSVDSIVFGAVNPGQVRETVQLLELPPLAGHVTAKVHALFSQVPEDIITPGSWGSR